MSRAAAHVCVYWGGGGEVGGWVGGRSKMLLCCGKEYVCRVCWYWGQRYVGMLVSAAWRQLSLTLEPAMFDPNLTGSLRPYRLVAFPGPSPFLQSL
jgi:hypothetical protein